MRIFWVVIFLKTNQYSKNTMGKNNKNSKELNNIYFSVLGYLFFFNTNSAFLQSSIVSIFT